jgi:TRAP-type C4-dicarboxylate transport system substrate-binding protein
MNLDAWKSLPKDIQDKLMSVSAAAGERAGRVYDDAEAKAFVEWEKVGVQIYTPPSAEVALWKKAVDPVWNDWIKQNEAKGLPAKKVADEVRKRAEK